MSEKTNHYRRLAEVCRHNYKRFKRIGDAIQADHYDTLARIIERNASRGSASKETRHVQNL
jgi:hypothetical protein